MKDEIIVAYTHRAQKLADIKARKLMEDSLKNCAIQSAMLINGKTWVSADRTDDCIGVSVVNVGIFPPVLDAAFIHYLN